MIVLHSEDIHCGKCVARINAAFDEAGIAHSVDLDKKDVTVQNDADESKAREIMDDLGFEV